VIELKVVAIFVWQLWVGVSCGYK